MIGTRYRHMTAEMQARVVAVIGDRLAVALAAVPQMCPKAGTARRRPSEGTSYGPDDLRWCGGGAEGI
jgi:hypothetical protein